MTSWIRLCLVSSLALAAAPSSAELDAFPTSGATLSGVSFGTTQIEFFFNTGDQVSETLATSAPSVNGAVFDLVVPTNNAQVAVDFGVFVNDVQIGSISIPAGQTGPLHQEFDFPAIQGPDYTVRLTETNTVPGGQGSLTIGFAGADAGRVELVQTANHYACRQVKDRTDPKFAKILGLPLSDDFGAELVDVQKTLQLCSPADQDGSGIGDPSAHLCCYKIKAAKLKPPVAAAMADEFGTHQLDVGTAKTICQPCNLVP